MTEAQRRLMHARTKIEGLFLNPIKELLEASTALVQEERARTAAAEATLEQLRPVWAQGYTADSLAAQATASSLGEIWQMLGVDNQTAAMQKLRSMVAEISGD